MVVDADSKERFYADALERAGVERVLNHPIKELEELEAARQARNAALNVKQASKAPSPIGWATNWWKKHVG